MNGAVSGRLLIQKAAHSHTQTIFEKRGITQRYHCKSSSMQDILEKVKDIKDSSHYDIGSWMSIETVHSSAHANQNVARSSKQMIEVAPKGTTG